MNIQRTYLKLIVMVIVTLTLMHRVAQAEEIEPLIFVGNDSYPPISYQKDGEANGVAIDIVRALEKRMKRPILIRLMEWQKAQDSILQDKADALCQLSITDARKLLYDFSEQVHDLRFSIFVRDEETGISNMKDLRGLKVGVVSGSIPHKLVETDPLIRMTFIPEDFQGFQMLKEGKLDAVVVDHWVGTFILAEHGIKNIRASGEPVVHLASAIAVKKGNTALLNAINTGIKSMKDDGTLARINEKWESKEVVYHTREQLKRKTILTILGFLSLLLVAAAFWILTLRREMDRRRNIEIMLRNSKEEQEKNSRLLRSVMDNTFQLQGLLSPDGKILDANTTALELINASKESVIGRYFWDTPWWSHSPALQEKIRQTINEAATGKFIRFESDHIDATGKTRYIDFSLKPLRDNAGDIIFLLPEGRDITDRKQTENQLQLQTRLQELLMNMSTTYINLSLEKVESSICVSLQEMAEFVDADRAFIYDYDFHNQKVSMTYEWCAQGIASRFAAMQSLPFSEAPAWDIAKHLRNEPIWIPDVPSLPQGKLREILEGGNTKTSLSYPLMASDVCLGFVGFSWVKHHHALSVNEQRLLTVFATMLVNIRQRMRAEEEKIQVAEQLRQSQKMEAIGTLAGGIAHDFNNILSVIYGYTEMAIDENDPAKYRADLEQVKVGAERAKELVKQILTFSRRKEHEKQALQVSLVVKEALKMLRSSIPTTIEIKQNISTDGVVFADPTQIHQVVMNLCTNSYHAMRDTGGTLTVSLSEIQPQGGNEVEDALTQGNYLKLEIKDTGCGISPEIQEKIFEPYFTTKSTGEGTGLGLAVVHGIVHSYNGHITVLSEPDKGTTFHIYLPLIDEEAAELPAKEIIADLRGKGERILFIDDEAQIRDLASKILTRQDYQVTPFSNGVQAFEEFQNHPDQYDLVITDMTMPHMTGFQLAQKIFDVRPDLPIILCSGQGELVDKEKALAMGVCDYLTKPIVKHDLLTSIRKALD